MAQLISFHSFRRGVGKSTLTANCAGLLAAQGARVGVMDINFAAPSQHFLMGWNEAGWQLNDFLWGECEIEQATYPVAVPWPATQQAFTIYLTPASARPASIYRMQRGGYYLPLLNQAFEVLAETLQLDYLLLDAPAGITEEALLVLGATDVALITLRLDHQDLDGTAILADLAQRLAVEKLWLVANQVPAHLAVVEVANQLRTSFQYAVAGILPYAPNFSAVGGPPLFVAQHPQAVFTNALQALVAQLTTSTTSQ